jgi:hypothetical protein
MFEQQHIEASAGPDIKNFALVFYERRDFDFVPDASKVKYFGTIDLDKWHKDQVALLKQQVKQIRSMYPNGKIHVITNLASLPVSGVFVHQKQVDSSHLMKLEIYGFIDEPVMYIDTDIIMLKRFSEHHLVDNGGSFNLYVKYPTRSNYFTEHFVNKVCKQKLPASLPIDMWNCSVVHVLRPDKKISEEMKELHFAYFDNRQGILDMGRCSDSDELPTSLYSKLKSFKMAAFDDVAVNRVRLSLDSLWSKEVQSVHYSAVQKDLCLKEYPLVKRKMLL